MSPQKLTSHVRAIEQHDKDPSLLKGPEACHHGAYFWNNFVLTSDRWDSTKERRNKERNR